MITWEKKIPVLSEVDGPSTKIGKAASENWAASQFEEKFRAGKEYTQMEPLDGIEIHPD